AVALAAGTDELAAPAWRDRLPAALRALIERAEEHPDDAEAMFRTMTPASMIEMIHAGSHEGDLAVYRAPGFAAAFEAALAEGFAQGPGGYARDTLLAMRRWTFDLGAIRCPVQLWYGEQDTSPVHSLDHGASLARRIPGATLTVVRGAGGALPWTHGAEILGALRARR
ncbi:MAG: alpha/beta hydrolase, partial [Deltaproteobacteria bacterium]|nr:alpha/beta hydrolase [Kofleriaceae bacterium]